MEDSLALLTLIKDTDLLSPPSPPGQESIKYKAKDKIESTIERKE